MLMMGESLDSPRQCRKRHMDMVEVLTMRDDNARFGDG